MAEAPVYILEHSWQKPTIDDTKGYYKANDDG